MKVKISCSSPKFQPPFLLLGLSQGGLQQWLECWGRRWCAHQLEKAGLSCQGAALSAGWPAPRGAQRGSAGWEGSWSHLQTHTHGTARPYTDRKPRRWLWGNALKILHPGGKRNTVAVPEAWLPQAPSSSPFPRLGTVGDRFCCPGRLSLPAHLSLSP